MRNIFSKVALKLRKVALCYAKVAENCTMLHYVARKLQNVARSCVDLAEKALKCMEVHENAVKNTH
jgi:hypothetical protein